ncbi:MAG TPA: flavodoxin family protein [Candidatus Limnocylindrales bacterium]|nr:flavodoxin family protein [Candidatus Limnocylindrales bacterium]
MKVIAFNGSARKDGNTAVLLKRVLSVLEAEGIETELIQLAGEQIHGCNACGTCFQTRNLRCVITDDHVNAYIQKMVQADGIILGSPTYFGMMSPEMKALIDRAGFVCRATPDALKYKVGAAVAVARRAGAMTTFDAINHFFLINQMIVPGSSYWNIGVANRKNEIGKDEEALKTMDDLGRNMAWLLRKIKS